VTQADDGREPAVQTGTPTTSGGVSVADVAHGVVRARMSEYLGGTLGPNEYTRVDQHIGACRACAAYLATLRKTVELVGSLPPPTAPSGAREAILRRARAEAAEH